MHRQISNPAVAPAVAIVVALFIIAAACGVQATDSKNKTEPERAATETQGRLETGTSSPATTRTPVLPGESTPDTGTVTNLPPTQALNPQATPTAKPAFNACGSGPVLTHSPMVDGTFTQIIPLGNLAPPSHTFPTGHMYFALPFEMTGGNDGPFGNGMVFPAQSVYAVADARIARLAVSDVVSTLSGEVESYQEFGLRLEVCDGLWISYGHVGPLSDRLQALVDEAEPDWCNSYSTGAWEIDGCEYTTNWTVEAGEFIAFTSGRAAAFDFGATRPEGSDEWTRVSECPLNLYGEEQRVAFEDLLDTVRLERNGAPLCGTVYQDVPGTSQGRWFQTLEGHPTEDQNIALVHDNFDPSVPVFSMGNSLPGVQSDAYRFVPAASGNINREFALVTPDTGVACYEDLTDRWGTELGMTLLVEMPDENTLRIEAVQQESCGSGPWSLSTTAVSYLR